MMKQHGRWQQVLCGWLLAAGLASGSGCASFFHSVEPAKAECALTCQELPKCCRDHVYIFLVHGVDPLDFANLAGVREFLLDLGFNKVYYGQLYHASRFANEIRKIHQEDAEAHFVLIGFSFGANMVRNICHNVDGDGVTISLLVYMGGNTLKNIPEDQPENAGRLVNILASGCIWNGAQMDAAENIHETDVYHFGTPTHRRTLRLFADELANVAASVPIVEEEIKAMPSAEDEPTPRPVRPSQTVQRDDWDFLKPVTFLRMPFEHNGEQRNSPAAAPEEKTAPQQHVATRSR
jgi:hypothetical protein